MYISSSLSLLLGTAVFITSTPNIHVKAAHLRTGNAKPNTEEIAYLEEPWAGPQEKYSHPTKRTYHGHGDGYRSDGSEHNKLSRPPHDDHSHKPDLSVTAYDALALGSSRLIASCGTEGFYGRLYKDADNTYWATITAPSSSKHRSEANVNIDIRHGDDSNRGDVSQNGERNFIGRNTGQFRAVEFVFDKAGTDPRCWTTNE